MDEHFRMLHAADRRDLLAEAALHRTARLCRRRPGAAARFYARLWWASRPRTVTGTATRSLAGLTTSWG